MLSPDPENAGPVRRRTSTLDSLIHGASLTPRFSFANVIADGNGESQGLLDADDVDSDMARAPKTTLSQSLFNTVNSVLGVGILSLPYALKCSGWVMGLLLLLFLLLVTNYTAKLLKLCMQHSPGLYGFPEIGRKAFGRTGEFLITVGFFFELFTASCMFIILAADHLHLLFNEIEQWKFIILASLLVWPTCLTKDQTFLSYFSLLGIVSSIWVLCSVVLTGFLESGDGGKGGSILNPAHTDLYTSFEESMVTYGLIMVGFAGHAVMPTIYQGMAIKDEYNGMVDICWVILGTVYTTIAVCGYLMYGENCADEITKNMFASSGGSGLMKLTTWLIVFNPLSKFALTMSPVALSLEEIFEPMAKTHCGKLMVSMLCRTSLVVIACFVCIGVPNFAKIVGFIGSVFSFSVSILFPCAAYVTLYGDKMGAAEKGVNYFLMVAAIIMGVLGTVGTAVAPE